MAHKTRPVYLQCMSQEYGKWQADRWIVWDGHPDDEGSQIIMDFNDKDYRKYMKSLPPFVENELYSVRWSFTECKAPKRGKLRAHLQEDLDLEVAEEKDGTKVSTRKRVPRKTKTKRVASGGMAKKGSED